MNKVYYGNGKVEKEETLIERNIGLGREVRKKACAILEITWEEYRKLEMKLMKSLPGQSCRLKDMRIGRKRTIGYNKFT